ncbi:MAG: fused MFS/spermidine synthase [Myxococcaceae bacterium]|nr:fused MFS/spermidine synthase [Myxococcaceae bacterium]
MSRGLLSVFLVLSGATGLVYEVIWSKALADVLGNSGQAHAIVLATFMGGLALGAWVFGGVSDRVQRPLALYGVIELFVGLYALVFPSVQQVLGDAFLSIAGGMSDGARPVAKLTFAALSLLPPTIAMGGTMPAMLKHATRGDPSIRATLAHLYAVNSFGAALGAWFAGTVSLPALGLSATARWAAAINLGLAAVTIVLARAAPTRAALEQTVAEPRTTHSTRRETVAAMVGLVLSGFTAMLYETGWIRVLTLVVGGSTYAFTWIVCSFILGIALGSFWISRRPEADELQRFGWLQVGVVVTVALTIPLFLLVPWLFLLAKAVLARSETAFPLWQFVMFASATLVMLAPTFLMGAAFPAGARVVAQGHATVGKRLGLVWAGNTIGTVLGALLGGLWLMPAIGLERLFSVGLVLSSIGALGAVLLAPTTRRRALAIPVVVTAVVLSFTAFGGWGPLLAQLSPFRVDPEMVKLSSPGLYLRTYANAFDTNFVKDDTFATVYVGTGRRKGAHRFLLVNGKPDASTGLHDQATQVMLGQLGMLLAAKPPKQVMVIGAGAAVTVGSALTHPLERLDLVEISPGVLEAARYFSDVNRGALDDPRVTVTIDDARTALSLSKRQYDLIVSEPSNPWVSGISSLFTEEFFSVVDQRLSDDGVLVQWIHTYEMNTDLLRLVMRTLQRRFPEVTVWQGGEGDLLLLASRKQGLPSAADLAARLGQPAVRDDLARIDVELVEGVLARQMMTSAQVKAFAGDGPSNSDDHNLLEYEAPVAFWARASAQVPDFRARRTSPAGLALEAHLAVAPLDRARARALSRSVAWSTGADHPLRRAAATAWLRIAPEDREAAVTLADAAIAQGDATRALSLLPPSRDAASALLELKALTIEEQQRRGPWLLPVPFDPAPFEPFLDAEKLIERLCERRTCPERPN